MILELKNVHLRRGETVILSGLSWHVARGEHWAVIGPNGSGKTTMLKIAAGALWPTAGQVHALGHRYGEVDLRALRRRIGWVSSALDELVPMHESALGVVLSGRYASFGLYEEVTDNDRRRARELLAFFNCEDLAERRYGVMSQGEKQRVLVARALMADAEILILDEPAAGLDIPAREALLSSVERLAQNGEVATITFVTHHVEEIVPAFTHVVVLKEGRIVAAGPKREMLTGNVLTRTFGVPLVVEKAAGRFWPRIADNGVHCNSEQEE